MSILDARVSRGAARVAHLTTVHQRNDVRIFRRECLSLASRGYDVHLLVADGRGSEYAMGVRIHDVGRVRNRIDRMLVLPWRMWRAARQTRAQVYHFHDPELIPIGLLLHWGGARVVYDSHEDVPRATMTKLWIHPALRQAVAQIVEWIEDYATRRFAAVVGATPRITQRFLKTSALSVNINNFPLESELEAPCPPSADSRTVCYIGLISQQRGIIEMVRALEHVDARLILAGPFGNAEAAARALPGWKKVDYRGIVSRDEARLIMCESRAGLLFFKPEPNHLDAQPNKMFEYMSAGLPVLASDFPMWRELLKEIGSGRCTDPLDPRAIARLIDETLADPDSARKMGDRGRAAVVERFQWNFEEQKLSQLYSRLLS